MSIYLGPSAKDIPVIFLERWSIRETPSGNRYFVGFCTELCDGRVSTPIVSFDPRTRIGLTESGREYRLMGRAGFDKDADYVWNCVVSVRKLARWADITKQLCPDWRNPLCDAERHEKSAQQGCGPERSDD